MIKKTIFLAYGIKLIATWMLIPFVLMFVPILVKAVVLLITFLLTLGKKKLIRKEAPKLSKVTDITGIICSISMSAALIYGVVDNTLMGLGVAYMFLVLGMIYTTVFTVSWIIAMRYYSPEELKND